MTDQFSFMADGKWAPERTGDHSADCATGRRYAKELIAVIRQEDNPAFFGTVARAITEGGQYGAIEIGFCSVIGIEILTPSRVAA